MSFGAGGNQTSISTSIGNASMQPRTRRVVLLLLGGRPEIAEGCLLRALTAPWGMAAVGGSVLHRATIHLLLH